MFYISEMSRNKEPRPRNMISDDDSEAILGEPGPAQARVERLIAAANEAGGLDNVSVVVVEVV